MTQIIVTNEELDALKKIQTYLNQITVNLGTIEIQLQELSNEKSKILKQLNDLKIFQNQIGENLRVKYGVGSIDLDTGEFVKNN